MPPLAGAVTVLQARNPSRIDANRWAAPTRGLVHKNRAASAPSRPAGSPVSHAVSQGVCPCHSTGGSGVCLATDLRTDQSARMPTTGSPSSGPRDPRSVSVLVPALDEAASIGGVLRALPAVDRVLVVDNGSTDDTTEQARAAGAEVVHEPRRGYGSACLAGLAEIARQDPKPAVVVFLDADASDDPSLLPQLVGPILADEADLVLGSRMLGEREPGAMPPVAVFGNRLASWLMRTFWNAPYTDLGPFRAIRYDRLLDLGMVDRDYGWTMEMQIKAHRRGLRVREVPVPYRRRIGRSKISGTVRGSIGAGVKILSTLARYGIWR